MKKLALIVVACVASLAFMFGGCGDNSTAKTDVEATNFTSYAQFDNHSTQVSYASAIPFPLDNTESLALGNEARSADVSASTYVKRSEVLASRATNKAVEKKVAPFNSPADATAIMFAQGSEIVPAAEVSALRSVRSGNINVRAATVDSEGPELELGLMRDSKSQVPVADILVTVRETEERAAVVQPMSSSTDLTVPQIGWLSTSTAIDEPDFF